MADFYTNLTAGPWRLSKCHSIWHDRNHMQYSHRHFCNPHTPSGEVKRFVESEFCPLYIGSLEQLQGSIDAYSCRALRCYKAHFLRCASACTTVAPHLTHGKSLYGRKHLAQIDSGCPASNRPAARIRAVPASGCATANAVNI